MSQEIPTEIKLKTKSRELALSYEDQSFQLSYEFLRVHSPSAEVQGHGQPILQTNKENVLITNIEPVGNYGIKIVFNDGHDTGIYTWTLLREFCLKQEDMWVSYLQKLKDAGTSRTEH